MRGCTDRLLWLALGTISVDFENILFDNFGLPILLCFFRRALGIGPTFEP